MSLQSTPRTTSASKWPLNARLTWTQCSRENIERKIWMSLGASESSPTASDGRIQVIAVDLSLRDASARNYRPLSSAELDVLDGPTGMWRELGV